MEASPPTSPLDALLKAEPSLWRGRDRYNDQASIPTGFDSLDNALPSQGWHIGGVTELLVDQEGIGEFSLLLPALRHVTADNQWAAFVNPPHIPYAPALGNAGIRPDRLLIINSQNDANTLWAAEQVLRAGIFASVVVWLTKSTAQKQRRLQLAAETGKTWATVYRPLHAGREHSPVSTRIVLSLEGKRLSLDIIKVRSGTPRTLCIDPVEFDHSQGSEWPVASQITTQASDRTVGHTLDQNIDDNKVVPLIRASDNSSRLHK